MKWEGRKDVNTVEILPKQDWDDRRSRGSGTAVEEKGVQRLCKEMKVLS